MTYGLQVNNATGDIILNITDKTIRLANVLSVTSPSSGTTTVAVSSTATPSNSVAVLENGASATVTSAGTVTLNTAYFTPVESANYNTKLKVFLLS